jgi:hypothetical protein
MADLIQPWKMWFPERLPINAYRLEGIQGIWVLSNHNSPSAQVREHNPSPPFLARLHISRQTLALMYLLALV